MSDHPLDPPVVVVETLTITKYSYAVSNLLPHKSVQYDIYCYNETAFVKHITGLLEGEQYEEWTTDDWLDAFIRTKVEELNASA